MSLLTTLKAGRRLYDRATGRELAVQDVERHEQVVFLYIKNFRTGAVDRQPFALAEVEQRFELLETATVAFRTAPEVVSLVAEAYRLQHAYLFNPLFATETSLIDLLPHQLAAVYGVPATAAHPTAQPGMLDQPRLRFLLADDHGDGVPARGAAYGGGFLAGANPQGPLHRGARRVDALLPDAPQLLRHRRRADGGVYPARAVGLSPSVMLSAAKPLVLVYIRR